MRTDLISGIFKTAEDEERYQLYEHEVYEFLKCMGGFSPPATVLLENHMDYPDKELMSVSGDKVVLKIVSPHITHKTDIGGIKIVEKTVDNIRKTILQMMTDVPEACARMFEGNRFPGVKAYAGLSGRALKKAIEEDIKGVLLVQYVHSGADAFGSGLIVGIKNTREFGMIITAGIGGTDTELFADTFRKGQAFITAATAMTTGESFLAMFKNTVSYKKLAGLTRGQKKVSIDSQLLNCFSSFISLGNYFSLSNPDAPYVIEELEINPFVFHDSRLVPLDGLCRFSRPGKAPGPRPRHKIENLLHPRSIGIIGVSTTRMNFGQIILNNIIANGFDKGNIRIIRPGIDSFNGVKCVPGLEDLDVVLDLLVVAVGAEQVPDLVLKVSEKRLCESVMLIPGGIGETPESMELARDIEEMIRKSRLRDDGGPVFLGANCLGVVSHPGKYDTLFIPEEKLPKQRGVRKRNIAFISQSGAFMITRLSKVPDLDPAYMISVGNQNDLTMGDMISYLKNMDDIDVIAVYAEGFKDLDGLNFIKALNEAVTNGKDVVVYKAGKTAAGRSAAGSHTASIAGDYHVFESCVKQAGGILASDFTQFTDLLVIAGKLNRKKTRGRNIAALSGAGFEAVGMADSLDIESESLRLAELSETTVKKLEALLKEKGLAQLTEVKNPMDLNPGADDEAHILAVEYLLEDANVDAVIAGLDPLSPVTRTLSGSDNGQYDFTSPGSMVNVLPETLNTTQKPVIGVIDAGRLYDTMADELSKKGMVIFRSADRAVKALTVYMEAGLSKK